MFEINLTCPVCGGFDWKNGKEGSESFVCADCGTICKIGDMEYQCFTGR